MDGKELIELKRLSKELIRLNDKYHEYLYLKSFDDLKMKRDEVFNEFGIKVTKVN